MSQDCPRFQNKCLKKVNINFCSNKDLDLGLVKRAKAGDNKGDERGQRGYSDLPGALPAAGDAGLTFSRQSEIHSQGLKQEEDLLGLSTPSPSARSAAR